MTYGYWLDQTETSLRGAGRELRQASQAEISDALHMMALRDECVRQLTRLALLLDAVALRRGARTGVPSADSMGPGKDPTVAGLVRALPVSTGILSPQDATTRTTAAGMLRSAAAAASTAGDILASHVDPTNGPRTPEGAAIRLGAGRPAAVGDIARLAVELAHVDEELLAWIGRGTPARLRDDSAAHQALTTQPRGTDVQHLVTLAGMARGPGLVRPLEVAPALATPDRPRTPDTAPECAALIDDFRLWVFRHPEQVGAIHLPAATRVGLFLAIASTRPDSTAHQGWRAAALALNDIAARSPRRRDDVRSVELAHVADLIRTEQSALDHGELYALARRLGPLASTLDVLTHRLLSTGALLAKHIRLNPAAKRNGVVPATERWTTAMPHSPAVIALLAGLDKAAAAEHAHHPMRPPPGRAFPPIRRVTTRPPPIPHDQRTNAPTRPHHR